MTDRKNFEKLALIHLDNIYRAAIALCRRHAQAEDLTQVTFLKAFERFDSFRPGTNCKAWLMQILRNSWIDNLRHKKVVGTTMTIEESLVAEKPKTEQPTWTNAEDLLENFSDEQIIHALGELPEDQRLTLFLIDVEEMSQEEVAEIMNVAVGTIKSRTSRARAAMKDRLWAHAQDLGLGGRTKQ